MNGVMEIASEVPRTLFSTRGQVNSASTKGVPRASVFHYGSEGSLTVQMSESFLNL